MSFLCFAFNKNIYGTFGGQDKLKSYIMDRVIHIADYIINTGCTLRFAAKIFAVSKSTAHKDMSERLWEIDRIRYENVRKKTNINLSERHIRGGIATRNKYKLRRTYC